MLILRTVTYFIAHYVLIGLFVNFIAQILFYILLSLGCAVRYFPSLRVMMNVLYKDAA